MNRMLRMKIQDGGRRDEPCGFKYVSTGERSGYTFGHNETLLLISLCQKYEVFFSDVSYKKKAGPGPHISTGVFLCRQSELFLAFRPNHSYSRIVDKKTRPKSSVFIYLKHMHEVRRMVATLREIFMNRLFSKTFSF